MRKKYHTAEQPKVKQRFKYIPNILKTSVAKVRRLHN